MKVHLLLSLVFVVANPVEACQTRRHLRICYRSSMAAMKEFQNPISLQAFPEYNPVNVINRVAKSEFSCVNKTEKKCQKLVTG